MSSGHYCGIKTSLNNSFGAYAFHMYLVYAKMLCDYVGCL